MYYLIIMKIFQFKFYFYGMVESLKIRYLMNKNKIKAPQLSADVKGQIKSRFFI